MIQGNVTGNHVKATKTSLEILEVLQRLEEGQIVEIADHVGKSKSTIHRHLKTLESFGYVTKRGDAYILGLRFVDMGESAKYRSPTYEMAEDVVREIAVETGERSQFIVEERGMAVYVHCVHGEHGVHTDPGIGKTVPLHAISAGRAIMAHLPPARVLDIIDKRGLPEITEYTITDEDALMERLSEIRDRGYSLNDQESVLGLRAVGVPVLERNGLPIGGLSVSGPTKRISGDLFRKELPEYLMGVANELELNIEHG